MSELDYNLEDALLKARLAVKLSDINTKAGIIDTEAEVLWKLERFDDAIEAIDRAISIDPQERLLLEATWQLYERIGVHPDSLVGSSTGVYVGISGSEYLQMGVGDAKDIDAYSFLGTAHSAVVGRISYWLGLEGPNMPVDTACSSSLVSLHLACQGLRHGDCDVAIAGGVNTLLSPFGFVYFSRLRAMSPTGRCQTFGKNADGYVRAEGCGMVLLKRLSDAQRDGDEILGLVRGSAVNQDGKSNGFTAPNGPAQQAVIQSALNSPMFQNSKARLRDLFGSFFTSLDNFEVVRLAMLSAHYKQPLNWNENLLVQANKNLENLYNIIGDEKNFNNIEPPKKFFDALLNDLNTPEALKELFELAKDKNSKDQLKSAANYLGILQLTKTEWINQKKKIKKLDEKKIEKLISDRNKARKEKKFSEADKIRNELALDGIILEDSPSGTKWRINS